ncbi:alpha-ketoacid dehydrogenase subunit beta [Kamptonema cortianum]|nr:alpha-ketoacid dehydrogenase subunit beta [Geitlerinema splendidum]MDK3156383.1 alpha-ketoacid dehydrogenase subunit beta [Kamptonema cortianum]
MAAPAQPITKKNYLTALKEALHEEMERDNDVIVMGEDIGLLGGAFGVTDGLLDRFGRERVYDMPISEAAIVGVACGLCLNNKKVVVEMQFIDFISCGFDQIVNMTATYHYRTAGEVHIPMVIRGPAGAYGGGALYHSQMNEAWFCHSPGLKVVCPSNVYDAKGMLKAAIRDPNPVLFYEIKDLYRRRDIEADLPDEDFIVPFGKAKIVQPGDDITIVTYGQNVYHALSAAENLESEGYRAEVIDLRSLVPLDEETVIESVKKTSRLLVVNEAPMTCGFAGEVLARMSEKAFEYLDAPPGRITRMDTPVPWVKPLELYVLPSVEKITEAALKICKY